MHHTRQFTIDLTGDVKITFNETKDEATITITGAPVSINPVFDMRDGFLREGMKERLVSDIINETIEVVSRRTAMAVLEAHLIK